MRDSDDEFSYFTRSHIFAGLLVVAFGWGSIWVVSQGIDVAFDASNSSNTAAVISMNTATDSNATTMVDASPSQTPSLSQTSSPLKNNSEVTIIIGGDVMFDRGIRAQEGRNGFDQLASVTPLFKSADVAIVNLEGPITSNRSKTLLPNGRTTKELVFTFPPSAAKAMSDAGIDAVNIANNHTDNFGLTGLTESKKWLDSVGIRFFGDPWNASTSEAIFTKDGPKIALVGYHAFQPGFQRIVSRVKELSDKGDFVIVMPHWGNEYATSSSAAMKSQARSLVAAGAGAIVGSHPHVIMDHVWMGNVPVFYSIGNLLFDQYFSPDVMKGNIVELHLVSDTRQGHIARLEVYETSMASRHGPTVSDQPIYTEP